MSTPHPMRRAERQLSTEEAIEILTQAEFATLAMIDEEGLPYAVPISPVVLNGKLYFHSAMAGRKVEILARNPNVWVSVVGSNTPALDKFTTYFTSAMAWGKLELVTDATEKIASLRALCEKFTPTNMANFDAAIRASLNRTAIYALALTDVTGKGKARK